MTEQHPKSSTINVRQAMDLAIEHHQAGRLAEAETLYRQILNLHPHHAHALHLLGIIARQVEKLEDAAQLMSRAVEVDSMVAIYHNNLGVVLLALGKHDAAIACFQNAMKLQPYYPEAHSNLILVLLVHRDSNPQIITEELKRWSNRYAAPLKPLIIPHVKPDLHHDPERRLKVGYVSADFRENVSDAFLDPLLRNQDHNQFEIFIYAQVAEADSFTRQFRSYADRWCDIFEVADQLVAEQIRRDQIDILVDLKLHTNGNRLPVFAYKPAPIQMTWLGYPGSTGLETIDYRLTDPYLDPPGSNDPSYIEESIRLPDCFWCYDPLIREPAVNSLPALTNGYVTFGSLNHFSKLNDRMLEIWARVLAAVPDSRLLILAPQGEAQHRVMRKLEQENIVQTRLKFVDRQPRITYFKLYHQIDLALDTLPYNGHTTNLDAFWMGVPVVTLTGGTVVGRAGWSQLCNLGLPELAAQTPEEYIKIAISLAGDLPRLSELRSTLRQRMESSPLMDAKQFTRNIEVVYRNIWRKWCAAEPKK